MATPAQARELLKGRRKGTPERENAPMADTATADAPTEPVEAAPVDDTVAVDPGDVYVLGFIEATGEKVLGDTADPEDDALVWLAENPEPKVMLTDLDDQYPDGGIVWDAEPELYEPGPETRTTPAPQAARIAAAAQAARDGLFDEADSANQTAILDQMEAQVAAMEGATAGLLLNTLSEERYIEEPDPEDEPEETPEGAVVAAVTAVEEMDEKITDDPAAAEDELEADDDAAPESTDDPAERIATLKERIDMLETQIAELTTASAVEEEIIDEDDLNKTSVDERVKDDE